LHFHISFGSEASILLKISEMYFTHWFPTNKNNQLRKIKYIKLYNNFNQKFTPDLAHKTALNPINQGFHFLKRHYKI